ncbi:SOS response-associated peptidase [Iningainema tapete]|uniref:Abasic site processing protein n=1 Tax=Iningainema tapete BLCC-T55 TaxID=2748662 RepID=A0A8J6XL94_9CYAN|nr:SOS response-associated peptidase [Iningainema tapete]MBD2775122.1 SOS response-associated peptidase [Iningainema tapete BLCC-T55]
MCGRYTLTQSPEAIAQAFQVKQHHQDPKYNIAPTQMVEVVLHNPVRGDREIEQLRWGLIPSWTKDPGIGAKLINARSETAAQKPAFRSAFKHRRCLVIADGFYEWQLQNGKKQPFYFHLLDKKQFAFAGLWEQWESPQNQKINSCTILTTTANELVQPIHERMPVILQEQDYDLWLDQKVFKPEDLQKILKPYVSEAMTAYPVSTLVNNPKHNSQDCIMPLS